MLVPKNIDIDHFSEDLDWRLKRNKIGDCVFPTKPTRVLFQMTKKLKDLKVNEAGEIFLSGSPPVKMSRDIFRLIHPPFLLVNH